MELQEFNGKLKALAALVGKHETAERFNEGYEGLHEELATNPAGNQAELRRLRRLGDLQLEFLANAWLVEDRKQWAPGWVL